MVFQCCVNSVILSGLIHQPITAHKLLSYCMYLRFNLCINYVYLVTAFYLLYMRDII